MKRAVRLGLVVSIVVTATLRTAAAASLPPRIPVENRGQKDHVLAILGAHLTMSAGLSRTEVGPTLRVLDHHLAERLAATQPAVVYPDVITSIVKTALLRGWSGGDAAVVLARVLAKIDEGRSPEMTRQTVVLAIVNRQKAPGVLMALAQPPAPAVAPE